MSGASAETITVREVADKLGMHPNTIYAMIRENRFPVRPLPLPQRKYLFSRQAIDRFLSMSQ